MISGHCGKSCSNCTLFSICGGCNNSDCLIYRCFNGERRKGLTDNCRVCRVRAVCPKCHPKLTFTIPEVRSYKQNSKFPELSRFIPEIKINDVGSHFWNVENALAPTAIFIKYYELMSSKLRYKALVHGIHKALGFYGKVFVSAVMPDELLDRLNPIVYGWKVNQIKADAITTIDSYTYSSYPLLFSWLKTFEVVKKAEKLVDIEIPKIGIVKGATLKQVKWCVDSLVKLGYRFLGFPCRELIEENEFGFIRKAVKIIKAKGVRCILLGCVSPKIAQKVDADHFSGLAWFTNATRRRLYTSKGLINVRRNLSFRCDCPLCSGEPIGKFVNDVLSMASHNLHYITEATTLDQTFLDAYSGR